LIRPAGKWLTSKNYYCYALTTFAWGEPVLATLAAVLLAYGMYALFSLIFRRQGGYIPNRSSWRRLTRLSLVGGVGVGIGLFIWCCLAPDKSDQRLKLAGFLGTVYAEGWPDRVDHLKYPPVKSQNQGSAEQPAYALLHPETPANQVESEKKFPKPRPNRTINKQSANTQDKAGKTAKVAKAPAPPSKKDKNAAKNRAKKKSPTPAAAARPASAG
jgi:hypothetical protein